MPITRFLLLMPPDDWRSGNRMVPLGSIRSDTIAASRLFACYSFGFSLYIFNVLAARYCVGRLGQHVIFYIYRII